MADYCTAEEVYGSPTLAGYLAEAPADDAVAFIAALITRSSRRIDAYVSDNQAEDIFAPSSMTPSDLTVYGSGLSYLETPPHVPGSVTTVVAPDGYTVPDFTQRNQRLYRVESTDTNVLSRHLVWRDRVPFVVTARWGMAAIPLPITEACLQLIVRTYRGRDEGFSGVIGNINKDNQIIERSMPAPVKEILEGYRRAYRARGFLLA